MTTLYKLKHHTFSLEQLAADDPSFTFEQHSAAMDVFVELGLYEEIQTRNGQRWFQTTGKMILDTNDEVGKERSD